MSKRKPKQTDPEFVVMWRGVQVWTVRARDLNEAMSLAVAATCRPERELGVAMVPT
jgi:hypothetical protein